MRLDVVAIDVDLYGDAPATEHVTVPGSGQGSRVSWLVAGAAIAGVIALGLIAIKQTDSINPEPAVEAPVTTQPPHAETVEPSTSNPSAEVSTFVPVEGDPLVWQDGAVIGDVTPVAIIEHEGSVLVFAGDGALAFGTGVAGLRMWRSTDGVSWDDLGVVIDRSNRVTAVVAAPDGLVAVGADSDGAPTLWESFDGVDWSPQRLPVTGPADTALPLPTTVAVSGDIVVVAGTQPAGNEFAKAFTAVIDRTGLLPQDLSHESSYGRSSATFVARGPFGLTLFSASGEELGLTESELNYLNGQNSRPLSTVWTSTGEAEWHTGTTEAMFFGGVIVTADGDFVLTGFTANGTVNRVSHDGIVWQDVPSSPSDSRPVARWRTALVSTMGFDGGDLGLSTNGETPQRIAITQLMADSTVSNINRVTASDQGIAALASTSNSSTANEALSSAKVILVRDGYTLTSSINSDNLVLSQGDTKLQNYRVRAATQSAGYVVNFDDRTVTFVNPDTDEPYVTFTLDELRQAESAGRQGSTSDDQGQLVLFSPDAHTWSINDLNDIAGPNAAVAALQVTTHGLIAAIATNLAGISAATEPSTVQIFTADLHAG